MTIPKKLDIRTLIARAGRTNAVARELGVTSSAVSQWLRRGTLPDSEAAGRTNYSIKLMKLAGISRDQEWDVRLIGRK